MFVTLKYRHILKVAGRLEDSQSILDNNPAAGLARAVAKAWELYGSDKSVHIIGQHLHQKRNSASAAENLNVLLFADVAFYNFTTR